jgi:hypothetical protein
MQKTTSIIATTTLAMATCICAFELGTHKTALSTNSSTNPSPYSVPAQTEPAAPPLVPQTASGPQLNTAPELGAVPNDTVPSAQNLASQPKLIAQAPAFSPRQAYVRKTVTTTTEPELMPEEPVAALPPPYGSTYIEKRTTTTETISPAPHQVYVQRRVVYKKYYKRNDKVHVGRAVKHTTMFALKFPGRVAI